MPSPGVSEKWREDWVYSLDLAAVTSKTRWFTSSDNSLMLRQAFNFSGINIYNIWRIMTHCCHLRTYRHFECWWSGCFESKCRSAGHEPIDLFLQQSDLNHFASHCASSFCFTAFKTLSLGHHHNANYSGPLPTRLMSRLFNRDLRKE